MTAKCVLKAEAAAAGYTRYTSSTPCPKGHGFERLVINGNCTECHRATRRISYRKSSTQRDVARETARWNRAVDPLAERQRQTRISLKAVYGLTERAYAALFESQNGCCAVCGTAIFSRLDALRPQYTGHGGPVNCIARVDHCHSTNVVRGLLCSNCNIGLGKFQDDPQILLNAVRYLRESATAQPHQPSAARYAQSEKGPARRDPDRAVSRGSRRDELSPFLN